MCRAQLPVWQQFLSEQPDANLDFISVAVDAQGPTAARPYAESTLQSFPTVVDADNELGDAFGFKAIPNGILVGADGRVNALVAGGFDIRRDDTRQLVEGWLSTDDLTVPADERDYQWSSEALRLFREAGAAQRRGERERAIELLRQAVPLEPDNLIIRKQLWAIEHPEKFYEGDVDYAWQRSQLEAGR